MHIGPGEKPGPMFCGEDMRDKPHLWTTTGRVFKSRFQLHEKVQESCGFPGFFVFAEYLLLCFIRNKKTTPKSFSSVLMTPSKAFFVPCVAQEGG